MLFIVPGDSSLAEHIII